MLAWQCLQSIQFCTELRYQMRSETEGAQSWFISRVLITAIIGFAVRKIPTKRSVSCHIA
ncbi:hypothetical protein AR540_16785 [Pseudomonas sp. EpS/L25]|nr:hypothetical protein AR540_16785 [Pseudomonas sp. EpS/L25]